MSTPNPRNLTNPVQFKISMSETLKEQLAAAAEEAKHTLTTEIVRRLEGSLEAEQRGRFDFTSPVSGVIIWLYQTIKHGGEVGELDDDLCRIIIHFAEITAKGTDEERERFYGERLTAGWAEELVRLLYKVEDEEGDVAPGDLPPLALRLQKAMKGAERRAKKK
jgi:hypothetical protein